MIQGHVYRNRITNQAAQIPPGYPHGDAWGHVMGHPESHDVERYLIQQAEKQKKKGKK